MAYFFSQVRRPYRVLIVDDDDDVAMYHRGYWNRHGWKYASPKPPRKCRIPWRNSNPDVILMDLHLPEFNGIELSAAIRRDQSLKEVPIVFASVAQDLTSHLGRFVRVG